MPPPKRNFPGSIRSACRCKPLHSRKVRKRNLPVVIVIMVLVVIVLVVIVVVVVVIVCQAAAPVVVVIPVGKCM